VARWPVVELLHAYMNALRQRAAESHKFQVLIWATLGPRAKDKRPPKAPSVLDE
jgi:hypothetical protein